MMEGPALAFLPSRHGFRFVNSFDRLPELSVAGLSGLPALPRAYGLCGGMSLDARGRYLDGQSISRISTVPEPGTQLFNRLWEKQLASFGTGWRYVAQFAIWMALSDGGVGGVQRRTFDQWPSIRSQLNRNRPVCSGLFESKQHRTSRSGKTTRCSPTATPFRLLRRLGSWSTTPTFLEKTTSGSSCAAVKSVRGLSSGTGFQLKCPYTGTRPSSSSQMVNRSPAAASSR
jgi:hypothetical protein